MPNAELFVALYMPRGKSMAHWAIHLRILDGGEISHLIYQANGDEGQLDLDIREANPRNSTHFSEEVKVSNIDDDASIDEVKQILERQPMKNNISSWNCQDWVMEALQALDDESLLDEFQYSEAKDTLLGLFNN